MWEMLDSLQIYLRQSQKEQGAINSKTIPILRNLFMIVLARDRKYVDGKIREILQLQVPYVVICGEKYQSPNVIFVERNGKWDAINKAAEHISTDCKVVALNDVDTEIHGLQHALSHINDQVALVYCKVVVRDGAQVQFYKLLDPLRKRFHFAV